AAASAVGQPKTSLALIALGGYGRGELNPFSDVDVMLLHGNGAGKISAYVEEMAQQILYLLWDIGFKVGHSTRSMKEALTQANRDMLTKTAMLESRFLAGDRTLAREFRDQFRAKCVGGSEREYVEMRMRDQEARHRKFGDSVYMQEPNLKNGCGGLRDYQNLLWMSYFKEGALTTTHLVGRDWLSESDQHRIEMAYDFLLRLRTETKVGSFSVRHGQLHPDRRDLFKTDPLQMMQAFQLAQEHNVDFSPELEDLISRALGQITRTYRYAKAPREIFKEILSRKGE